MLMTHAVTTSPRPQCREDRMRARLDALLEGWAEWSRTYHVRAGYERTALSGDACISKSFDDMCAEMDRDTNELIDAAVDDLPPACRAALYRHWGLAAVFRFPRENYLAMLDQANDTLLRILPGKGVMLDF